MILRKEEKINFRLSKIYTHHVKVLRNDPGRSVQGDGPQQGDGGVEQELRGTPNLAERGRNVDVPSEEQV